MKPKTRVAPVKASQFSHALRLDPESLAKLGYFKPSEKQCRKVYYAMRKQDRGRSPSYLGAVLGVAKRPWTYLPQIFMVFVGYSTRYWGTATELRLDDVLGIMPVAVAMVVIMLSVAGFVIHRRNVTQAARRVFYDLYPAKGGGPT